jgi:diguanylate cyclase (GGDEF)-like protein/PAS domain S-box-containing protein
MDISLDKKVLWFNVMFMGVTSLPTLFLIFILEFTGNMGWLNMRRLWLLSIHPLASLLLVWTNPYHHIYYLSIQMPSQAGFELVRGPWYFANAAYSYMIIAAALAVLGVSLRRAGPMYRQQYSLILLGSLLPWLGSIYEAYFGALNGLDLAPLVFGISGILCVFATLRIHFSGLAPVARSYVLENLQDGILVLDRQNRIMDINPAMAKFLENKLSSYMGMPAPEIFETWLDDVDQLWEETETRLELKLPSDPSRYLDLRVTPLYDRNHRLNGRLMVFRDSTERNQVEKRLRYVNDRLQSQLIEIGVLQRKLREQAIRDPLTNLFNRRYLEETLDRELARAGREAYSICLIMIDLDHFKRVNDSHGHEAGDLVLKGVAGVLSRESRRGDFACRYGGEEFVVVMPNLAMEHAYERAQTLRNALNAMSVPFGYCKLRVTISMGIACYPLNGDTREAVLRAADQAMYAAKKAGRDHILSYDQLKLSEDALGD